MDSRTALPKFEVQCYSPTLGPGSVLTVKTLVGRCQQTRYTECDVKELSAWSTDSQP